MPQPPRGQVRLAWRLVLCLFAQLMLLLFLAIYLVLSLNSVRHYAPIIRTEEIQLESLDTIPSLLGALDAERRDYRRSGAAEDLELYRQTRQAAQDNLDRLNTPLLLPSENESRRRALAQRWLATIGDATVARPTAPPAAGRGKAVVASASTADAALDQQSRDLLDQIRLLSQQGRDEIEAMLSDLQDQEEKEANEKVNLMWLGVGSITFMTILLQLWLANSIIGPIQALGGVVRRLQAGDYTARVRLHSGDEIQNLGDTFNAMAENILRNQQALQETNARLEERVAEKTEQIQHTLAELEDRNQKLSAAARLKDEFLATLSHELRTPLTPVISCAHLLATDPSLDAAQLRQVQMIDRNARALSRMIDELLDLSAVMNRKLRLAREPVELNEWARTTLETMRPAWEKKRQKVTFTGSRGPVEVKIDPARLAQVLTNLINNAIKFTPEKGKIEVSLIPGEEEVRIAVTDSGAGLHPQEIERIFEMFHQERTRQTQGVGGLGVGLTVARSLAELHGGGLLAESPGLDRGSTFTLWLPRREKIESAEPAEATAPKNGAAAPLDRARLRGRRLLLVEDSTDTRHALETIFRRRECRVQAAASAEEALELARHEPPEILISDVGLPGMSGVELIRELRGDAACRGMIAVALSGLGREGDIRDALAAGFDAHFLKPVEIPELERMLIEALGKIEVAQTETRSS